MFNPDKVRYNYKQLTSSLYEDCVSDNAVLNILSAIKAKFDAADLVGDTKYLPIGAVSFVVMPVPNTNELIINMYPVHWREELKCTEAPFATLTIALAYKRIVGPVADPVPTTP